MKRFKRVGTVLLAGSMLVSLLGGCGNSSQTTQGSDSSTTATAVGAETVDTGTEATGTQEEDGDWTGETSHIVMTLITGGTDPVVLEEVQEAVNEISVKKIGVEVEFKPVSVFDAPSQAPMWIAAGEQIDLMACAFTGLSPFVDMNMIMPLEGYLEECAPGLQEMAAAGEPIYDTTSKEHVYGVKTPSSYDGLGGGYLFPVDWLEEAGYQYENWDTITLDDLDEIFAALKENHPDSYSGTLGSLPASEDTFCADMLGATTASGVLIGTDSTEVVNYYASDEYYEFLKHMRDWYEKGYILKDAATSDASLEDNIKSGVFWGNFTDGDYGLVAQRSESAGKEWIALMLVEPTLKSIAPKTTTYWTVPVTAKEPEAAMRFLNLMMTDVDVTTMLAWGIEGEQYALYEDGGIQRLENFADWGLPGCNTNQRIYRGVTDLQKEKDAEWNEKAYANPTKAYGYCYDSSAMTSQLTAVQAVITEYVAALETGSADLDTVYPEFLTKLEANGINEIIADNQAQFDAWLAQQ